MTDRSRAEVLLLGTMARLAYDDDLAVGSPVRIGEVATDYTLVRKETHGVFPANAERCNPNRRHLRNDRPAPAGSGSRGGCTFCGNPPRLRSLRRLHVKGTPHAAATITPPALRPFSDRH
jgi:hypothetical protein